MNTPILRPLAVLFLAGASAVAVCLMPGCAASAPVPNSGGARADREILALLDAQLAADRAGDPVGASLAGDRRYDALWPDRSPAARSARRAEAADRLGRVRSILNSHAADLTPTRLVDARLLENRLASAVERARFFPEQLALTQQSGPFVGLPQFPARLTFTTRAHYEDYLTRLRTLGSYLDSIEADLRAGLAAGRTPPRVVLRGAPLQARAVADGRFRSHPEEHPMFAPFRGESAPEDLRKAARDLIVSDVLPAWQRFARFVEREYIPGCRETIGASELPDGPASYAAELRYHTTLDLSAEEIHQVGLAEVARIRTEMFAVIDETGFAGEHPGLAGEALFRAFTDDLRTDPRFYHKTAADLLRHYRDICKRMDAELPGLFGNLPRLTYGVKPLPDFIAPTAPTAYYYPGSLKNGVAGNFMANTSKLAQRPKYEAIALALHEAVPGHHLQGALAQELEETGLHEWRTTLYFTSFGEGWGLYSERLGLEVGSDHPRGMYADPYDEFGRLSYEIWRAMRLVVDTGIHAMGWTRDEAIAYMKANSALSDANIVSEVDRYIAWPGQATGYKIGELFIRDLREKAENELGDRFDLRAFHDRLLSAGSTTLPVLGERIDTWIHEMRTARR